MVLTSSRLFLRQLIFILFLYTFQFMRHHRWYALSIIITIIITCFSVLIFFFYIRPSTWLFRLNCVAVRAYAGEQDGWFRRPLSLLLSSIISRRVLTSRFIASCWYLEVEIEDRRRQLQKRSLKERPKEEIQLQMMVVRWQCEPQRHRYSSSKAWLGQFLRQPHGR